MSELSKLNDLYIQISKASTSYSEKLWTSYTSNLDFGIDSAYEKMVDIFKNKKNFELICEYREKSLSSDDKRRVDIAYNSFEGYHLSDDLNELSDRIFEVRNSLSKILNNHRSKIDGKEVSGTEVSNILSSCEDENLRKKAYTSKSAINKVLVDAGFIELLNLRKEYAKLYGSKDFVEMSLKNQELSPSIFDSWKKQSIDGLPTRLEKEREFAKSFLNKETLSPWDYGHLHSKMSPLDNKDVNMLNYLDSIDKLYTKFGFNIKDMNLTFDVFPRKNKSEWGYQFTINPGVDSRILANIDNKYRNFFVLLHEAGHGVHYNSIDPQDKLLNDGISGIISEGIANLFGYMAHDEIFYSDFFKDEMPAAKEQFSRAKEWSKVNSLGAVESILFDQSLYTESITTLDDINQLKWKMAKELNGIEKYDGEPNWGFKIHHTTHPIYLHNYFMGDVTCEMLKKSFCKKNNIDDITKMPKEFGSFLQNEVIAESGRYKFEDLFRKLSGEDFNLSFLLD